MSFIKRKRESERAGLGDCKSSRPEVELLDEPKNQLRVLMQDTKIFPLEDGENVRRVLRRGISLNAGGLGLKKILMESGPEGGERRTMEEDVWHGIQGATGGTQGRVGTSKRGEKTASELVVNHLNRSACTAAALTGAREERVGEEEGGVEKSLDGGAHRDAKRGEESLRGIETKTRTSKL